MHEEKFSVTLNGTRKFFPRAPVFGDFRWNKKIFPSACIFISFLQVLRLKASLHLPFRIFLSDIVTLVLEFLTSRQSNLHLHKTSLKINLEGNQGESLLLYL